MSIQPKSFFVSDFYVFFLDFRVRQGHFYNFTELPLCFGIILKYEACFLSFAVSVLLDFDQDLASLSLSLSSLLNFDSPPWIFSPAGVLFWREALGHEFREFIGTRLPQPPQSLTRVPYTLHFTCAFCTCCYFGVLFLIASDIAPFLLCSYIDAHTVQHWMIDLSPLAFIWGFMGIIYHWSFIVNIHSV